MSTKAKAKAKTKKIAKRSKYAPKVNKKLLRATLAYIKKDPKHWNQTTFRWGTSMCFAGWACMLDGGKWANPGERWDDSLKETKDYPEECANDRAERILGITRNECDILFDGENSLEDLTRFVKQLCDGEQIVDWNK